MRLNLTPALSGRSLILISILLSAFNLRTAVTSLSPLLGSLSTIFGFNSLVIGVLGMLAPIAFAITGAITPAIMRAINLERTIMLSMVLASVGLLLRSMAWNTSMLILSCCIALLGMGMGNVVLPPLVKRYFPQKIARLSTLYITSLQLGTMLPAFMAVPIAQLSHWRIALGWWAAFSIAAFVSWHQARPWYITPEHTTHNTNASQAPHTQGRVYRSPIAWGITFMFGMTSLITYSSFTWIPKIFVSAGASESFGGAMVGLFSALGLLSALTVPVICGRFKNPFPIVVIGLICFLVAFAGLYWAPMKHPFIWIVFLGIGPSTFPLGLTLINLRTTTQHGSASLSGFMQGIGYLISCTGPILFGVLYDISDHSWTLPFLFLTLCAVILAIGGYHACKPQMLEDTWHKRQTP